MNRNFRLIAWFVFWLLGSRSWAQGTMSAVPDSLARFLRTANQDTTYVRAATQYAWWLINRLDQLERADSLLKQTQGLARSLKDSMGLQRVYFYRGRVFMRNPDVRTYQRAVYYLTLARQLIQQAHLPPSELQRVFTELGYYYLDNNQFELSLKYSLAAIKLTERYHLTDYCTKAYTGAGEVMDVMGNRTAARQYYQKADAMAYLEQDKYNLLGVKQKIAQQFHEEGQDAQAVEQYRKALAYADRYGNRWWRIKLWNEMAQCHIQLGQLDQALSYLKRAQQHAFRGNPISAMLTHLTMGSYYAARLAYPQAESHYKKAIRLATAFIETRVEREAVKGLIQVYVNTHRFDKAFTYQVKLGVLNDSLFSNLTTLRLRELANRHELEKRESQINLLQKQKQIVQFQRNTYVIMGGLLLLLSVAVAAWLLNRARWRGLKQAGRLRQQLAHDLHDEMGSTLSSISLLSSMVNTLLSQPDATPETPGLVRQMVTKIYSDTRQIQETIDEFIWSMQPGNDSLAQIADRLRGYTEPLLLAKNTTFQFAFDASLPEVPLSVVIRRNLYLLAKEAINNVVKYAQATVVVLRFEYHRGQLMVLIEDNGRGFDPAVPTPRTGLRSMDQRAKAMGGSLAIRSAPGQGTRLELRVAV